MPFVSLLEALKRRKALYNPSAVPLCFILADALSDTAHGDIHAL